MVLTGTMMLVYGTRVPEGSCFLLCLLKRRTYESAAILFVCAIVVSVFGWFEVVCRFVRTPWLAA